MATNFISAQFHLSGRIVEWRQIPGGGEFHGRTWKRLFIVRVFGTGLKNQLMAEYTAAQAPSITAAKDFIKAAKKH